MQLKILIIALILFANYKHSCADESKELIRVIEIEYQGGFNVWPLLGFLSVKTEHTDIRTKHVCKYPGFVSPSIDYAGIGYLESLDEKLQVDKLISKIINKFSVTGNFKDDDFLKIDSETYNRVYETEGENYRNFKMLITIYKL